MSDRLKRGAYRAKPTKRVYIPKADGSQRPLGIPSLEDKIVQKVTAYRRQVEGTPQGGIISPLPANIYLHYVFDLRAHHWRSKKANGDVVIVRYADDFVVGFEHAYEARRFLHELKERFARFNLELHPEKTRLIEFGRYAKERRKQKGKGRPETFDFLGFTHICGQSRGGKFMVKRKTSGKRLKRKLQAIHQELKRRMHDPIPVVGEWLKRVLTGYYRYFAVPNNIATLSAFRFWIRKYWQRVLGRRSHKAKVLEERMNRLEQLYLPAPKIYHEWPIERFARRTQGRSPVR